MPLHKLVPKEAVGWFLKNDTQTPPAKKVPPLFFDRIL